jgi:hypothetical protein
MARSFSIVKCERLPVVADSKHWHIVGLRDTSEKHIALERPLMILTDAFEHSKIEINNSFVSLDNRVPLSCLLPPLLLHLQRGHADSIGSQMPNLNPRLVFFVKDWDKRLDLGLRVEDRARFWTF